MDYETLRFKIADGVAIITLDRKDNPANALNARMAEELFDVGVRCGAPDVRAVIVHATWEDVLWWWRSRRNGRRPQQTRSSDPNGHAAACRFDPACPDRCTGHHGSEWNRGRWRVLDGIIWRLCHRVGKGQVRLGLYVLRAHARRILDLLSS